MITERHIDALGATLIGLRDQSATLSRWAGLLARQLPAGHRLLAAGNGGSAAEAQHLTAELVGRFDGDRRPFSAIALHAETSSVTAISNDYGYDEVFARQVTAHAQPGDIVLLLSTSGNSPNLVRAAQAGKEAGATVLAMTGALPNALAEAAEETLALPGGTASVQEAQLIAVHVLCEAFEAELGLAGRAS